MHWPGDWLVTYGPQLRPLSPELILRRLLVFGSADPWPSFGLPDLGLGYTVDPVLGDSCDLVATAAELSYLSSSGPALHRLLV